MKQGRSFFPVGGVSDADFVFHSLQFLGVEPDRRRSRLPEIQFSFNS